MPVLERLSISTWGFQILIASDELSILNTGLRIASLVAQRLKHLPAMQETWVRSLGQEDPLEKEMTTHSSILAWRIPWTEEPGRCTLVCACLVTKLFLTAWTAAHKAPRSKGFSSQEYWNGLPFPPPPGSLPNPGIEPTSPASLLHFKWVLYHWVLGKHLGPLQLTWKKCPCPGLIYSFSIATLFIPRFQSSKYQLSILLQNSFCSSRYLIFTQANIKNLDISLHTTLCLLLWRVNHWQVE